MIPADVASRLRLVTPDLPAPPQPATPARQLADVLSDLVPGQRILAEIQALLPNGTYRAMVAQRDITLALPFSAKPGDSLELEVVESDGQLTLAFVANRSAKGQPSPVAGESASATLSSTGRLIGDLLGNVDEQGKKSAPAALNNQLPLVEEFPSEAAHLAPILKDALSTSGMFYEAHQARWLEGKLPTTALLQEPQGKLSPSLQPSSPPTAQALAAKPGADTASSVISQPTRDAASAPLAADAASAPKVSPQTPIPADLTPLVRQQLDALATQTYVWQGQVWPGQQMHWEIQEDPDGRHQARDEEGTPQQWQTRLQLTLPSLGGIDAVMRLRAGGVIELSLTTDSDQSRQTLAAAGENLREQLDAAGLSLATITVRHGQAAG